MYVRTIALFWHNWCEVNVLVSCPIIQYYVKYKLGIRVRNQRRYNIYVPLCAINVVLKVEIYMGAWAWNAKKMT